MSPIEWLQLLASYALQAALVIGVAALLDRWTVAATIKSRVWTACFISLLGLLAVGLLAPRPQWFSPLSALDPSARALMARVELIVGAVLLKVWLFGAAVMAARWVIDFVRIQRFLRRHPVVSPEIATALRGLVASDALQPGGKQVEFRVGPEDLGPFCYQYHKPLVFLPRTLLEGEDEELRHVLDHELTHLRTQHPLQLFLQRVVQCVLWFHPLVWIASGRANLVREFVCDDAAARDGASTAAYLRTLLRLLESKSRAHRGGLSLGRSLGEVRVRAARLVAASPPDRAAPATLAVAGVLATAVLASQVMLPIDPLAPPLSTHSPWPTWSATALHLLGVPALDFLPYDERSTLHELTEESLERGQESDGKDLFTRFY